MPKAKKSKPAEPTDDPRFRSVLPFVRGVCELLPTDPPNTDQQDLVAIAVRMSAADRDRLLAILRSAVQ